MIQLPQLYSAFIVLTYYYNYLFYITGYDEKVRPSSPDPYESNVRHADEKVLLFGPDEPFDDQFERCLSTLKPLLVKYNNDYCNIVYDGQCSINGAYQPSVLDQHFFIGTSSYTLPWDILMLEDTSDLRVYRDKAQDLCRMTYTEVRRYFAINNLDQLDEKLYESLPDFCFLVTYAYALLTTGYGFNSNATLTVLDQVHGYKVGWALGAILYEINTMPWLLEQTNSNQELGLNDFTYKVSVYMLLAFITGTYVGVIVYTVKGSVA